LPIVAEPVVDNTNTTALAAAGLRMTQLADSTATLEDVAPFGVLDQDILKVRVLIVRQEIAKQAGECRSFDEFQASHTIRHWRIAQQWLSIPEQWQIFITMVIDGKCFQNYLSFEKLNIK
jgi:hypothetical protein